MLSHSDFPYYHVTAQIYEDLDRLRALSKSCGTYDVIFASGQTNVISILLTILGSRPPEHCVFTTLIFG
jgi:hypothetical protein